MTGRPVNNFHVEACDGIGRAAVGNRKRQVATGHLIITIHANTCSCNCRSK